MLDYQHNIVRQQKKDVKDGGEERGRVGGRETEQRGGEQSKARESRTEQREKREQERAEGRGEEGRRGGVEVMMWQRQKGLREIFVTKGPICKYSHEGEILGSRFDLDLKSGSRL